MTKATLRELAEERLRETPAQAEAASPETAQRLLHELQVHQVELEMQNEELRRTQVELENSHARYFDLYELAPAGYLTLSDKGLIKEINLTAATMLGIARKQLIKQPLSRWVTPAGQSSYYQHFRQLLKTGQTQVFDLPLIQNQPQPFWTQAQMVLAQDADGAQTCRVVLSDINLRKQAESDLQLSEGRFRTLALTAPVGIYLTDEQGNCTFANAAWCAMGGLTPEEALGQGWKNALHPEDRDVIYQRWLKSVESNGQWGFEYRFQDRQGKITWVYGVASPLRDETGQTIGFIGANVDINARKQAEQFLEDYSARLEAEVEASTDELRQAQDQLLRQEKFVLLGQLAGSVGHELRNPLSVIKNSIYYLKQTRVDALPKEKEYLDIIEQEVRTSENIIADLLDLARVKTADPEPVSVSRLVDQSLQRLSIPASLQVVLELPLDLPSVYVDSQHIIQVLSNLALNACQAMAEGGRLTISAQVRENMVAIAITDSGAGISAENMTRLFEPFFTTRESGVGLGLVICQRLVQANGSRIEVQSEPGKGSCFSVYVPIYEASK